VRVDKGTLVFVQFDFYRDTREISIENVRNVYFKRHDKGGIQLHVQLPHAPTHITQGILQTILSQYKIHHAEITLREDITVDELIDVIESTDKIGMARVYIPCVYVCNMIDKISIEELDLLDRIPHYVPISARDEWNLDGMLETMWDHMSLLRVYTKPKGQIPDYNEPVVLPSLDQNGNGPTCEFFCNRIHKALIKQFKCENKCLFNCCEGPTRCPLLAHAS
jgi:ribosome-interacting GTPase 1